MFNISTRQMEKMMKQLGIESEEIDAEEVIIRGPNKEIVIKNPKITKINMQGNISFQITGNIEERVSIKDEDIDIIVRQVGCNREEAKKVLKETNGDIAEAILKLKGE